MKAPRCAHWLLVPTLVLGMVVAPVRAHAAPSKPSGEQARPPAKVEDATPPKDETGDAAGKTGDAAGKTGDAAGKLPTSKAPKREPPRDATDDAAAAEPTEDAPTGEVEAAPEGEGGTPEPDAATPPPDAEPTEAPAATEPSLEPAITLKPSPVTPGTETSVAATDSRSRDVVVDPRRVRSDERILFRAGILSLGVAAAAVVPTVVGLQQAYAAHVDDDPARERTMRGLGIGAGIAAGTYAITGIVLMSLGARSRRAALAPAAAPGQLGLVLRARF